MKTCKRLFAAAMVVLMAVTIMPLGIFASASETYQITTLAQLKEILEGLRISNDGNSTTYYPADGTYVLENDISPLGDWLADDANRLTAAEQLGMYAPVPAVNEYVAASEDDIADESVTLYTEDGGNYTEVTDRASIDPDNVTYYVYKETTPAIPQGALTDEDIAALTPSQKEQLIADNNIENVSITPAKVDFTGTFDGCGRTISGMTINQVNSDNDNAQICAMFTDVMAEATVKDLVLDSTCKFVVASTPGISLIVGSVVATNYGKIQSVTSDATIDITSTIPILFSYVGGIAGLNGKQDNGAEITGCTFGGTINYKVTDEAFDETNGKKLSSADTAVIDIGGITGESEAPVTGTFNGSIDCNFIGGTATSIFEQCAGKNYPSGTELTVKLANTDKNVDSKDADVYFTDGTTTKGEPNDKGYQLIKNTKDGKDTYYIRQTAACNHNGATEIAGTPATCAASGLKDYWYCENCESYFLINPQGNPTAAKASYNKDIVIPKLKLHESANVTHTDAKDATCTEKGNKEYWYCSICEQYFTKDPTTNETNAVAWKYIETAAKGHSYSYQDIGDDAQHNKVCSRCGDTIIENHDYGSWSKKDDNQHVRSCKDCKHEQLENHSLGAWEDYTSTQHRAKCSVCNSYIRANHNYCAWEKYTEKQHRALCEDCQHPKYASHTFDDWQKYDEKQHVAYCKTCNEDKFENHNFKDVVTKPTTTSKGYTTYTCKTKTCGYSYKDNYTDPIPSSVIPKDGTGYSKDDTGKYLITALPTKKAGITVSTFKKNLKSDSRGYVVRDEKGNEVTSGNVKTGYTVEIKGFPETKVTIVVKGDANKDGKISALDYVKVKNHILKKVNLKKDMAAFLAADANGDGKISALDYVKIKNLILKG